jgi:hypothetical protein
MTNPFTSETYTNIWAAHYCKDKLIVAFETIKKNWISIIVISTGAFIIYLQTL